MNGWDVRPTLDRASATGRSLAQAAGSLVAGSPLPQALIQCRQRLTDELRLGTLVILSWSVPQPVAGDSAVAQPTTASSPGSSAPQNGPGTRRHATSRARCHSAHIIACRAAWLHAPASQGMAGPPQWRRYPAHNWRHFPARLHLYPHLKPHEVGMGGEKGTLQINLARYVAWRKISFPNSLIYRNN